MFGSNGSFSPSFGTDRGTHFGRRCQQLIGRSAMQNLHEGPAAEHTSVSELPAYSVLVNRQIIQRGDNGPPTRRITWWTSVSTSAR